MISSPDLPAAKQRARYAISAVFLVMGTLVGSWLPHIPDVKRHLGATDLSIGSALLCSGLGALISMQLLGSLIHRFGSRNVSFVGGLGACVLVPPLMLEGSIKGLALNLFLVGLCYGCLDVGMNSHSVQVQALHERPILAAIHGWFSFGGIVGGATAALTFHFGIDPFHHVLAIAIGLAILLVSSRPFLLPSSVDQASVGPRFMIPRGKILTLGLLCACAFLCEGGVLDWCALYLRESLRAAPEFGGAVTGLCSGSMALSRFVGDPILHRFGDRKVVFLSGILTMLGIGLGIFTGSVWVAMASFACACFGIGNMVPVFFKEAGSVQDIPTSVGVAAVTTCGYGGFLLGPPVIGMIANKVSLGIGLSSLIILGAVVTLSAKKFTDLGKPSIRN